MHLDETKGFPGGIHPTDGYDKSLTMDVPVREYWPETVTILAEQSFRGPCSLKVRPGDHVRKASGSENRKLLWRRLFTPVLRER